MERYSLYELQDEIENLIDQHTLVKILDTIATICHEKADHVSINWDDAKLQKFWDKMGVKIQYVVDTAPPIN
jgi:hypothetical protein